MSTEKRDPAIRTFMMPRDTNQLGSIFGGHILSLIDLAAAHHARGVAPLRFVTKVMREVEFIAPVYVGDVVSFYADTVKIGKTSITIKVEVEALRADHKSGTVKVTEAEVVMVAVDEHRVPVEIGFGK
jgi:acyl-CoA thioesterase YciA